MQDIAKVQNQLNALGDIGIQVDLEKFFTANEIKYLPKILAEDEKIIGIVSGSSKTNYETETQCYFVATNCRIIQLSDKILGGISRVDISYEQITGIAFDKHLITADIIITIANTRIWMKGISFSNGEVFVGVVNEAMRESKKTKVEINAGQILFDVADQIEKLAKLKERGLLTEEEFNQQKRKLLL